MSEMNKQLEEELRKISFNEICGKNTSQDDITADLSLFDGRNTAFGYADVRWESTRPEVVNELGVVMGGDKAETVTLTAEFTYQDYPDLIGRVSFDVTVSPSTQENKTQEIDKNKIRIFIAGDSTACDYPHSGKNNRYPQTGWGQVFGEYFNDEVLVINRARSGRSSKSFLKEDNFKFICDNIQKGDYLFIQFAHNDCKANDLLRYTSPDNNSYQECIYTFINTARIVGAYPVLCTSITRNILADTTLVPYADALKEIGEKENIPVVDLYKRTHTMLEEKGEKESSLMHMHLQPKDSRFTDSQEFFNSQYYDSGSSDDTHLNINGARVIAQLAVDELKRINHPLVKYLK